MLGRSTRTGYNDDGLTTTVTTPAGANYDSTFVLERAANGSLKSVWN